MQPAAADVDALRGCVEHSGGAHLAAEPYVALAIDDQCAAGGRLQMRSFGEVGGADEQRAVGVAQHDEASAPQAGR